MTVRPAHDHITVLPVFTGSGWLWVVVLAGVVVVTGAALLRPVAPREVAAAQLVVALAAGCVGLVLLLLTDRMDLGQEVVALLVVAMGVAVGAARHRTGAPAPVWVRVVRSAAPWVVAATTVAAARELLAWWAGGPDRVAALHTALFVGVVGLGWLMLCRPGAGRPAALVSGTGWVLANAVLGAATVVLVAALPA